MRPFVKSGSVAAIALLSISFRSQQSVAEDVIASAPYCATLQQIAEIAAGATKFAPIRGRDRQRDFADSTLSLEGWTDCAIYGPRTYTCDSSAFKTSEEVEKAIEATALRIAACPGKRWMQGQQSSPSYTVLANSGIPVSITLSTAQNDNNEFVMRLVLFARRQ